VTVTEEPKGTMFRVTVKHTRHYVDVIEAASAVEATDGFRSLIESGVIMTHKTSAKTTCEQVEFIEDDFEPDDADEDDGDHPEH
jgi:hypothetical protein